MQCGFTLWCDALDLPLTGLKARRSLTVRATRNVQVVARYVSPVSPPVPYCLPRHLTPLCSGFCSSSGFNPKWLNGNPLVFVLGTVG